MRWITGMVAGAVAMSLGVSSAMAQTTPIRISYAPSLWWSLPFFVATQKKWWAEVGLEPTFAVFPSGPPQVAALQANAWDVGATGVVPTILGAARFGMKTIGIANDESTANAVVVKNSLLKELRTNPAAIKGKSILLTSNSTSDYATQSCLRKWGLTKADVKFVNLSPPQIVSAVTSDNGDIAGVWAPYIYTLQEKGDSSVLCSGADAGAFIPSMIVANKDFAAANPEAVAKYLAVYLRAWGWIKAHPADARVAMKEFYAVAAVDISPAGMDAEFKRPVFDLSQQLSLMDRAKGASQVDAWLTQIANFVTSVGTLQSAPETKSFITDEYMRMVANDPKLKAVATKTD